MSVCPRSMLGNFPSAPRFILDGHPQNEKSRKAKTDTHTPQHSPPWHPYDLDSHAAPSRARHTRRNDVLRGHTVRSGSILFERMVRN